MFIYRRNYIGMLNEMKKYQTISFDIFDTTLVRVCSSTEQIFDELANYAENIYKIDHFCTIRKNAYIEAREEFGTYTTIHNIYDIIQKKYGLDKSVAINLLEQELILEKNYCIINNTILDVIKDLHLWGKQIVFTSDMYLTSDILSEIFKSKGLSESCYNEIIVSCEHGCTKANGKLFSVLKEKYGTNVIHIGDYYKSDFFNARKNGIGAIFFPLRGGLISTDLLKIQFQIKTRIYINGHIRNLHHRCFAL